MEVHPGWGSSFIPEARGSVIPLPLAYGGRTASRQQELLGDLVTTLQPLGLRVAFQRWPLWVVPDKNDPVCCSSFPSILQAFFPKGNLERSVGLKHLALAQQSDYSVDAQGFRSLFLFLGHLLGANSPKYRSLVFLELYILSAFLLSYKNSS